MTMSFLLTLECVHLKASIELNSHDNKDITFLRKDNE